jgi:rubredoxin
MSSVKASTGRKKPVDDSLDERLMTCPRCNFEFSREIKFYFEQRKVELVAQICKRCEYIYAEDEALLRAARTHLKILADKNVQ